MTARSDFFDDLADRLGKPQTGHNPIWFLELEGAQVIIPTAFEPDPVTHRGQYYYNAITNSLYRKVITKDSAGIKTAHWQRISE